MEKDKKISKLLDIPTVGKIFDPLDKYETKTLYGMTYPAEVLNFLSFSHSIIDSYSKKEKPVYFNRIEGVYDYNRPLSKEYLLSIVENHLLEIEECMIDLLLEKAHWGAIYSTRQEKLEAVDFVMNKIGFNAYSSFRKIDFLIMAYCKIKGGKT